MNINTETNNTMSKEKSMLNKIAEILSGQKKPIENKLEENTELADAPATANDEGESDGEQADENSQIEAIVNAVADLQTRVANIEAALGDQSNDDGSTTDGMQTALVKMRQIVELLASQPQSNPVRKTAPTPFADSTSKLNTAKDKRQSHLAKLFAEVKANTNTAVAQPVSPKETRNITPKSSKDNLFSTAGNVTTMTGGFSLQK